MIFLSVIIPAYNEEKRFLETLEKVKKYLLAQDYSSEVVIVDDGSTDNTVGIVEKFIKDSQNFHLISYKPNRGKGYAVKTGMLEARGEWRLLMDADNSTDIHELQKLLSWKDKSDIIIGSRYLNVNSIKEKQPLFRRLVSRGGNFLIKIMLGLKIKDTQCGFKLFSAAVAEKIFPFQTIDRWGFDMEILTIAIRKKYQIKEVAVNWYDAEGSHLQKGVAAKTLKELWQIKKNIWAGKY